MVHACAGEDGTGLTDAGTTEAGAGRVCASEGVRGRGGKARGAVESEVVVMVPVAPEMVTTLSMPCRPLLRCSAAPLLRCFLLRCSFGPQSRGAGCSILKMLKKLCSTGMMDFWSMKYGRKTSATMYSHFT